jgi:hypothetical protein
VKGTVKVSESDIVTGLLRAILGSRASWRVQVILMLHFRRINALD